MSVSIIFLSISIITGYLAGNFLENSMIGIIVGIFLFLYNSPIMIASYRKHPQYGPICILTIFGAWTGILWIAALAWSLFNFSKTQNSKH